MKYKILITGCGGDIGQSSAKILKSIDITDVVIGCDIHDKHPGKFLVDKFFIVPPCTSENYFKSIEAIINEEKIQLIIPTSEKELRFFNDINLYTELFNVPLIMANPKALQVGLDKLLTARFLEENNLLFPKTDIINKLNEAVFPTILKDRAGSGSRQIIKIESEDDFSFYQRKYPEYLCQEYLSNNALEYTCGLYRGNEGQIRSIIFKRTLSGGFSNYGEVERNDAIDNLLFKIAERLDLKGSINVQLRLTERGPVVFEINPRFSSTVLFRHLLGFKDLLWSIEEAVGIPLSAAIRVEKGRKFYKGYQEYYE
jgi:carbamoyl-phosphate synthase large subunit